MIFRKKLYEGSLWDIDDNNSILDFDEGDDDISLEISRDKIKEYLWIPEFIADNFTTSSGIKKIKDKITPLMLSCIEYNSFNPIEKFGKKLYSSECGLIGMIKTLCEIYGDIYEGDTISLNWIDISDMHNLSGLFKDIQTEITVDINNWDTSAVTNVVQMFMNSSVKVYAENLDLSMCTSAEYMFYTASYVPKCVETWKFQNLKDMRNCFEEAKNIKADISKWNTRKVKTLRLCFKGVQFQDEIAQNIGKLDVRSVEDFYGCFTGASGYMDLSGWNMKKAKDLTKMFYRADIIDPNISNWVLPKVKLMSNIFTLSSCEVDTSYWRSQSITLNQLVLNYGANRFNPYT